ncbi:hypothetical protein CAPN001_11570 [Capnocytophaga stomatis]|uniref:hypothetical protein n=1 Tax=Capnocytophaga stomatis TaxID=1848904 RepID=UPI0019504FAF|nr:hypothetical protein [Capnocytophaga stomatis]GIJ96588.1 hypothetical protein CAPN001_11570 [Capnocytophaga stomatis]
MRRILLLTALLPMLSFSQGKTTKKVLRKEEFAKKETVLDIYTRDVIWHMNLDRNMVTNSENGDTLYFKNTDKMFSYVAQKTLENVDLEKAKKIQDSILNNKKHKKNDKKDLPPTR